MFKEMPVCADRMRQSDRGRETEKHQKKAEVS